MTWRDDFNKVHDKIMEHFVCIYCRQRLSEDGYCCPEAYKARHRAEEQAAIDLLRRRGYDVSCLKRP